MPALELWRSSWDREANFWAGRWYGNSSSMLPFALKLSLERPKAPIRSGGLFQVYVKVYFIECWVLVGTNQRRPKTWACHGCPTPNIHISWDPQRVKYNIGNAGERIENSSLELPAPRSQYIPICQRLPLATTLSLGDIPLLNQLVERTFWLLPPPMTASWDLAPPGFRRLWVPTDPTWGEIQGESMAFDFDMPGSDSFRFVEPTQLDTLYNMKIHYITLCILSVS